MGHEEVVALARRNQNKQRSRSTRKTKQQPKSKPAMRTTSPGTNIRPRWLKFARNRIMKKILSNDFNTKSKEAAIQHAKETSETKQEKARKLLYSSSSENKSIASLDTTTLKLSPTVKVFSIPSDSLGTSYEIVASSTQNDFMNSILPNSHKNSNDPSCAYTADRHPKEIMKSTPKVDKKVSNNWKRQQSSSYQSPTKDITIVTIEDTSNENFPRKQKQTIEVVNLESTDEPVQVQRSDNRVHDLEKSSQQVDTQSMEEERTPATTSPAKSSISDLLSSDFYNPSEFWVHSKFLTAGAVWWRNWGSPGTYTKTHRLITKLCRHTIDKCSIIC